MIIINSVVLNPNISTRAIMNAYRVESKLKYNTQSYVTKSSDKTIVNIIRYFSRPTVPVHEINDFMYLIANGKYFNIAVSQLLCHLFYLRMFRYMFRLIKRHRKHKSADFERMMIVSGTLLFDIVTTRELVKSFHNHQEFMNMMFTIKAKLTMLEMFDLEQINRYWQNHHVRLNHHRIYRSWW